MSDSIRRPTIRAEEFLARYPPRSRRLANRVRGLLREFAPALREEVKAGWKVIGYRAQGYLCCIAPRPDGSVRFGLEHGGMLADARGILDPSTGTQMRWVTLRGDTSMEALRGVLLEALRRDEERFGRRRAGREGERAKVRGRSPWFTPALFTFLEELRLHNDRDWFERNKDRYVHDVRDPLLRFVADAAPVLKRLAPRLVADPRPVGGSMFRIHRDTRFSKDKTPYKTNAAASFRHAAGRDAHGPGLYVSLAPGEVEVGGGVWHPEAEPLRLIRKAIADRPAAWKRALAAPGLDRLTWWGDSLSRTPKGFPEGHPLDTWLRRKDFAAGIELTEADALAPDFLERCAEAWRPLGPALKLMASAVGLPW